MSIKDPGYNYYPCHVAQVFQEDQRITPEDVTKLLKDAARFGGYYDLRGIGISHGPGNKRLLTASVETRVLKPVRHLSVAVTDAQDWRCTYFQNNPAHRCNEACAQLITESEERKGWGTD